MDETTNPQRPQYAPPTAEPTAEHTAEPVVNNTAASPTPTGIQGESGTLKDKAIEAICQVFDPEIPVNIYELGLIYSVETTPENDVQVVMTLTSPMCPVAESLPIDVEMNVRAVEGVRDVNVELTWEPPWDPGLMSEAAKLELGFM
jgi:FeS assembly SUF system protein